jgi:hypothetical protein
LWRQAAYIIVNVLAPSGDFHVQDFPQMIIALRELAFGK